jgi:queuine tRNA-ribosyltransferase
MLPALAAATEELPNDRLRYLMGVGDPVSLVEAVALGVDLFDCVLPSRLGRHGTVLTDGGRVNLRNARYAVDDNAIDESSPSPVSARYSRGYVRHLLATDEPTARRLLTLHNVGWLLRFVERMRASIEGGRFEAFRADARATWNR